MSSPQPVASSSTLPPAVAATATAPIHHLPKTAYSSIEYPGPVSQASAILKVVSQAEINECINAPSSDNSLLEVNVRGDGLGAPLRGYRIASQKLLLKVVKKRRRRAEGVTAEEQVSGKGKEKASEQGIFTCEVVGPISQTVRFRSMADWHVTPNPDGPTNQLLTSLKELDYEAILDYRVPDLHEQYINPVTPPMGSSDPELSFRSLLDLQPVPLHSDRRLPPHYSFKPTKATEVTDWEDKYTGEIKARYVNRGRYDVPTEPLPAIRDKMPKMDPEILDKLRKLFDDRPVWTRYALDTQLSAEHVSVIRQSKYYIPAVAYTFGAGPYWKCLCRFGFDPRVDSASRIYQRVYFYLNVSRTRNAILTNVADSDDDEEDTEPKAGNVWEETQVKLAEEGKRPPLDPSQGFKFDGKVLHRVKPDYQLCDVSDPLISRYIQNEGMVLPSCTAREGWYSYAGFELIRSMIKAKFIYIRDNAEPAPDSICYEAIEAYERGLIENEGGEAENTADDVDMTES